MIRGLALRPARTGRCNLPHPEQGQQPDLAGYASTLQQRLRWVLGPVLILALAAAAYSVLRPAKYEATARVIRDTTTVQDAIFRRLDVDLDFEDGDIRNEVSLAQSDAVLNRTAANLNLNVEDLEARSVATLDDDTVAEVLAFTFRSTNPGRASLGANTWAEAYLSTKSDAANEAVSSLIAQLDEELVTLRAQRADITQRLQPLERQLEQATDPQQRASLQTAVDLEAKAVLDAVQLVDVQIASNLESAAQLELSGEFTVSARVFQPAPEPTEPVTSPFGRNVVFGAILGLLVGVPLALSIDRRDSSIRGAEDVAWIGTPVLGQLPPIPRKSAGDALALATQADPDGVPALHFHKIWTALQALTSGRDVKTVLVTSPVRGDGRTTVAANVALLAATSGSRVVLVDSDTRNSKLHEIFEKAQAPGLTDALASVAPRDDVELPTDSLNLQEITKNLTLMAAGTRSDNPAILFAPGALSRVLGELREHGDLVLLDTPPTSTTAEALALSNFVDGVVVVADAERTEQAQLNDAVDTLRQVGATVLGVVINRAANEARGRGPNLRPIRQPSAAMTTDAAGEKVSGTVSDMDIAAHEGANSPSDNLDGDLISETDPDESGEAEDQADLAEIDDLIDELLSNEATDTTESS